MFCTSYDSTTLQCDKTHSDSVYLYIQWKTADLDLELLGTASHQQAKKGLTATPRTKLMTIKKTQGGRLGLGVKLFKHFVRFSYYKKTKHEKHIKRCKHFGRWSWRKADDSKKRA